MFFNNLYKKHNFNIYFLLKSTIYQSKHVSVEEGLDQTQSKSIFIYMKE